MRQITLSDHAGSQASKAASARADRFETKKLRHSVLMEKRQAKAGALRESSRLAFAERRWFAGVFSLLSRFTHALTPGPSTPKLEAPDRDETVWNAGSEGERRVAETFGAALSDEWVLISGYRNPGGEVDQLLVGPSGLLAVEIKFINGRVFCDKESWWRDKYDKYGNLVERSVPIADRRGRSPSAQVNAAADRLQSFLNKRSSLRRVHRAVILSHDASELGDLRDPTVDLVTTIGQLSKLTLSSVLETDCSDLDVGRVVGLIERDHAFHARPRGGKKRQGKESARLAPGSDGGV